MKDDLSKLDLVGLLDQLKPIALPDKVSLWPQTVGWLVVAVVVFIFAGLMLVLWFIAYRSDAYRRAALREINVIGNDPKKLAEVLRRCALAAYPRTAVASLHGEKWLRFLDNAYGGTEFSQGIGRNIANAVYVKSASAHDSLSELTAKWVRDHASNRRYSGYD